MACRKCGSDWKTATGRDCQRCPHCDKVQRHLARKAGRWVEVTEQATCKNCGKQFTNVGANIGKAKCCSPECADACKKAWQKAYAVEYSSGRRRGTQASKRLPKPTCKRCGQSFRRKYGGNDANLYCSKRCFYDARNAGDHKWDRTNQLKATWHKMGPYSSAPSVMAMRHIAKCWKQVFKCQRLFSRMAALSSEERKCELCGGRCNQGASRFCSRRCMRKSKTVANCNKCGVRVVVRGVSCGPNGVMCCECRMASAKASRREAKRRYGRNHRSRARHHGVRYESVPVGDVYAQDGYVCQLCGRKCLNKPAWNKRTGKIHPLSPTIDHIVPMSLGGPHERHNLQTACFRCNSIKGARAVGQMRLRM